MNVFISNTKLIAWKLELIDARCVTRVYKLSLSSSTCAVKCSRVGPWSALLKNCTFCYKTEFAREVVEPVFVESKMGGLTKLSCLNSKYEASPQEDCWALKQICVVAKRLFFL